MTIPGSVTGMEDTQKANRPDPSIPCPEVPEGYEVTAEPDPDWRLDDTGRCRAGAGGARGPHRGPGRPACGRPSAAAMARFSYRARNPEHLMWWRYCEQHMYGRWIEDDRVMIWVLQEKAA